MMHPKFKERIEKLATERMTKVARTALVAAEGPRVAAWLVWQHRRAFRVAKRQSFEIPRDAVPRLSKPGDMLWFWVGMEHLRTRRGWRVEQVDDARKRVYQVHWLGRGGCRR